MTSVAPASVPAPFVAEDDAPLSEEVWLLNSLKAIREKLDDGTVTVEEPVTDLHVEAAPFVPASQSTVRGALVAPHASIGSRQGPSVVSHFGVQRSLTQAAPPLAERGGRSGPRTCSHVVVEFKRKRMVKLETELPVAVGQYLLLGRGPKPQPVLSADHVPDSYDLALAIQVISMSSLGAIKLSELEGKIIPSTVPMSSKDWYISRQASTSEVGSLRKWVPQLEQQLLNFCRLRCLAHQYDPIIFDVELQFDGKQIILLYDDRNVCWFDELVEEIQIVYKAGVRLINLNSNAQELFQDETTAHMRDIPASESAAYGALTRRRERKREKDRERKRRKKRLTLLLQNASRLKSDPGATDEERDAAQEQVALALQAIQGESTSGAPGGAEDSCSGSDDDTSSGSEEDEGSVPRSR